jgi:hypothetical protein
MDNILGVFFFGFFTTLLNYIPWSSIFLFTRYIGINLYVLKRKEECQAIQKRLNGTCSHIMDDGKGYGYAIGRWYIASISITSAGLGDEYLIWIIATKSSFHSLTNEEVKLQTDYTPLTTKLPDTQLTIVSRAGSLFHVYYKQRVISIELSPIGEQKTIIDSIVVEYTKKKHLVVLLHGDVGTGKSMIGFLVAKEVGGYYCNTAKFWEPGDTTNALFCDIEVTEAKPLIICFDEVDTTIHMIHKGIERHKSLSIQLQGKTQWNTFLDEIQMGLYPNIILILTTNKSPETIGNETDPSYLRNGRVDLIREMNTPL